MYVKNVSLCISWKVHIYKVDVRECIRGVIRKRINENGVRREYAKAKTSAVRLDSSWGRADIIIALRSRSEAVCD